jgi:hypothetical protein
VAHVFISYSRTASRFVGALAEGLRARGKDVWIDIERSWSAAQGSASR